MKLVMPRLHPKQDEIRRHAARFKVVSCGRRFGKTMMAVALIFACAAAGGAAWWVGPTSREAKIGWRYLRAMAVKVPGAEIKESTKEIAFPGGGWLAVLSAESATLRGEGLDLVVIDEAAFLQDLRRVWNYDLRAALSDRKGRAVFISSPDGRNYFYELFRRGQDADYPEWMSWQATSYDNPFLDASEIDAAKAELPDWVFRQEYMAEFLSFAGKVYKTFTPECDAIMRGKVDLSMYREFWGGIDFGFRNPTSVGVAGLDRDDRLDVIDGLYRTEMTTPELIEHMRQLQAEYNVVRWFADNAAAGDIAELKNAGLPVVGAPKTTGELERSSIKTGIVRLETRLVNGRLRIHESQADLIREMDAYRYAEARDGAEQKEAPLKVDDHGPDMLRYLVTGLDHMRGRTPRIMVAA